MTDIGHNSKTVDASHLAGLQDRILDAKRRERDAREEVDDLYKEVSSDGYDAPALRKVIDEILKDDEKRAKEAKKRELVKLYAEALGQGSLFD
jgi:uncharacterized protein (UPF0335 family)